MSATVVNLIIQIIAGVAAGNAAGTFMEKINLNMAVTTIAGALGGIAGGQLFNVVFPDMAGISGDMGLVSILGNLVTGGLGGAILTVIAGLVMKPAKR